MDAQLCSGYGQYHTDKTKSLNTVSWSEICDMVDKPRLVEKQHGQWLIPSTTLTRSLAKAKTLNAEYWVLWADIDKDPPAIKALAATVHKIVNGTCYEVYTSKSATKDCQKARVLIPLNKPLSMGGWELSQAVLNDKLDAAGLIPDRSNEGVAQLCYLPNKGEFYDSESNRSKPFFDPLLIFKDAIQEKVNAINKAESVSRQRIEESKVKREQRLTEGFKSPVDAFNQAYMVEDLLLQAGYEQKGNTFRHPNSESGSYSASAKDGRVHSLSTSDPLYSDGKGAHDPFSLFRTLFHDGNENAAIKDAGNNWLSINGESWNTVRQREYRQEKQANDLTIVSGELSPLEILKSFSVTGQSKLMREKMLSDKFVIKDLAILGQWTAFYAAPNTGKTLLTLWLIIEQLKSGEINAEDIFYVNVDDTYKGGVEKTEIAETHGFHMLLPDNNKFKKELLLSLMSKLAETGESSGKVIILDTLKKFTNIMDKKEASNFGDKCRQFVASGGTVICLAHVNKKKDDEGKSIFSGTADIVDDADCAYVIEKLGSNNERANMTTHNIEFNNIKCRGDVAHSVAFQYTSAVGAGYQALLNSVERLSESDLEQSRKQAEIDNGHEKDSFIIDSIKKCICEKAYGKTELIDKVVEETVEPIRKVTKILNRWEGTDYSKGHLWKPVKGDKNLQSYCLTRSPEDIAIVGLLSANGGGG